jgi:hypothetical protein
MSTRRDGLTSATEGENQDCGLRPTWAKTLVTAHLNKPAACGSTHLSSQLHRRP